MAIQKCEQCGEEFKAKPSENRKYCSRACYAIASKGKPQKSRVEKVVVNCAECGKEEEILPSRAKKYLCCSVECLGKFNSKRFSQKISCICPICNNSFELKPYSFNRVKSTPCCSKECASKLKEETYSGENNHQYGLKGPLNSSFKGLELKRKNVHLEDVWVYCPDRPYSNKDGRVTKHRLLVHENYELFDQRYFKMVDGFMTLKENINVHHIDLNHSNNVIENLIPLTDSQHTTLHNILRVLAEDTILKMIGVIKQGELLETPEADNQQPSLSSNTFEGSETNSRVLTDNSVDSNTNTSALLNNILNIVDDYIVRAAKITEEIAELEDKELLG
jgi:hypothetical protein